MVEAFIQQTVLDTQIKFNGNLAYCNSKPNHEIAQIF